MTVSVAIATYNGEKFIEEQLSSIMNQTVKIDQVIISDDCSGDNTVNICKEFIEKNSLKGWNITVNSENLGYCHNFYNAIQKCNGDVIFLCDQDDRWLPQKVEKMLNCLKENSDITVLSCRYNVIDQNSNIIENSGISYLGKKYDDSVEILSVDSFIGCSYIRGFAMCFKTSVKEFIKPIDLKSMLSHDWYICLIGAVTGKTAVLNTILNDYRYHYNNVSLSDMTRNTFLGDREKRLKGLRESINGHSYFFTLKKYLKDTDRKNIEKQIHLEKKRLKFLETKNIFLWLSLLFEIKGYKRYYKSLKGGFRVWIGDLCYAYNINFKK